MFLKLPREIRDLIYQYAISRKSAIFRLKPGIPWSESDIKSCTSPFPHVFLICRQIYHESRRHFYYRSTIELVPDRNSLITVSRRPARRYFTRIALLLHCSKGETRLRDPPSMVVKDILHTFTNMSSIVLLLSNGLTGRTILDLDRTVPYDARLITGDMSWCEKMTSACLEPGILLLAPMTRAMHKALALALKPLRGLPNLSELDLHLSTRIRYHSSGRGQAYVDTPQRRRLLEVLYAREADDVIPCLKSIVPKFPKVRLFRLWRLRQRGTTEYLEVMDHSKYQVILGDRIQARLQDIPDC